MVRFSLLSNALPAFTQSMTTEQKVSQLQDYQVQLLEYLRYTLSNLDGGNFNETGLKQILEPVLVEVRGVDGKVAALSVTADGIKASVSALGEDLTAAKSSITQTANEIRLEVSNKLSDVANFFGDVTSASIVAAINQDGSSVKISADKVDISGFVTFSDLKRAGSTTINGSNITTGEINADLITAGEIRAVNFISAGEDNSFILEDGYGNEIGHIGYTYINDEGKYGDKLWLQTASYRHDGVRYYPAVKIEAAGGVSITSGQNGVFIYDNIGTEWMFKDGSLTKTLDGESEVVA